MGRIRRGGEMNNCVYRIKIMALRPRVYSLETSNRFKLIRWGNNMINYPIGLLMVQKKICGGNWIDYKPLMDFIKEEK
jgi:hypothetical protein